MNQQLELVRAKVIEAVPGIRGIGSKRDGHRIRAVEVTRPIRLSDVLVAVDYPEGQACIYDEDGNIVVTKGTHAGHGGYWNPLRDSLDEQSPECIDFLAKVLGV